MAQQGQISNVKVELYRHEAQGADRRGIDGEDLNKHIRETGLIGRCLSFEDEIVKGWIADPSTYPEEFKGMEVFLWKSRRKYGEHIECIGCLVWRTNPKVVESWVSLSTRWCYDGPALVRSVV